jgi:GntR family transcriptional repressor for pyruvate dehydrogenase complex
VSIVTGEARLFESISDDIRSRVASGELKPGQKLKSERDLAEHYRVSRPAVREALRNLERGGLIELRKGPKGGTFIRGADPALVTQSLDDVISLGAVSIASLTESRTIVMSAVIRLACERGTDAEFDRLEESIDLTERLAKSGDLEGRRIQLLHFYRLLSEATRNEVLVILVSALTDLVLKLMARYDAQPRPTTAQTHRKIVRCLRQRSADEAVALMAGHLDKLHAHFRVAAMKMDARA